MPKKPPVSELEFLKLSGNHAELTRKLAVLGCETPDISRYAAHVCKAWFGLGEAHLDESKKLIVAECPRAAYSRAYYAAYNASKGVRYMSHGYVSLKGDDHGRASTELPADFPDVATWVAKISILYEQRLRADYDNWSSSADEFTISAAQAIDDANAFVDAARLYLNTKYRLKL